MTLLVVGSVAIDTIRTPDGKEHKDVLGGSCTYFSYAASFLTDVRVVAVVGEDFGQQHIDLLKSRGIDLDGLEIKPGGATFRWAGTYADNMNDRTTDDLQFGVLADFDPKLPDEYCDSPYLFLACAQPELQASVMDQMRGKPFVVSDTIEFYIENNRPALEKVFERSDGVIVNDAEAKFMFGDANAVRCAGKLLEMGPEFAVVKKGEHGGVLATRDGIFPFPAFPLTEVKDPTGAGDSFAAGFMGFLAKHDNVDTAHLRQAVVYGTTMASFACEGISLDRLARLTEAQVDERAKKFTDLLAIP